MRRRYYSKLPDRLDSSYVLMIDPMLATGGSASAALDLLRRAGATRVRIVCIVAAPEGIAFVERDHPDVMIYTPVVDQHLNAQKYIVPGLGDFGDRLYGTVRKRFTSMSWQTSLTSIEPNKILVRGYPLDEMMGRLSFAEVHLPAADGRAADRRRSAACSRRFSSRRSITA